MTVIFVCSLPAAVQSYIAISVVDQWMVGCLHCRFSISKWSSHLLITYVVEQFLQEFLEKVGILSSCTTKLHRPQVRTNLDVWNWNKSLYWRLFFLLQGGLVLGLLDVEQSRSHATPYYGPLWYGFAGSGSGWHEHYTSWNLFLCLSSLTHQHKWSSRSQKFWLLRLPPAVWEGEERENLSSHKQNWYSKLAVGAGHVRFNLSARIYNIFLSQRINFSQL